MLLKVNVFNINQSFHQRTQKFEEKDQRSGSWKEEMKMYSINKTIKIEQE